MMTKDQARRLAAAERKVTKTSEARRALPAGSSRARVTTANSRWAIACEARDRILREVAPPAPKTRIVTEALTWRTAAGGDFEAFDASGTRWLAKYRFTDHRSGQACYWVYRGTSLTVFGVGGLPDKFHREEPIDGAAETR